MIRKLDLPRHYIAHRWRRNHASSPPSRINNMCPGTSTSLTPWRYGQKAAMPCQAPAEPFPSIPAICPTRRNVFEGAGRSRGARAAQLSQFPFATGPGSRGLLLSNRSRIIDWLTVRISDERVTSTQGSLRQTCARGEVRGCGATVVFFCRNFPSVIGNTNGFSPSICE